MPWGAATIAVGTVAAGAIGANAARSAAKTQAGAANRASDVQLQMFNQTQQNLAPYQGAGVSSLESLMTGLGETPPPSVSFNGAAYLAANPDVAADPYYSQNPYQHWVQHGQAEGRQNPGNGSSALAPGSLTAPFTAAQFQESPGYQFQQQQGIQAIDSSASAKGVTGNTLKDLMTFGTGLANQDWYNAQNAYYGRQQQLYDMFSGQAGAGQNAASNLGGFAQNTGAQIGSNIIGAGNARAAGTVGAANAFSGGLNSAAQNYMLYQLMQQNQGGQTGSFGGYSNPY